MTNTAKRYAVDFVRDCVEITPEWRGIGYPNDVVVVLASDFDSAVACLREIVQEHEAYCEQHVVVSQHSHDLAKRAGDWLREHGMEEAT